MGDDIHLYCMSNGSEQLFPNNSLTKFQSKLPFKIEWNKGDPYRWYVALEGIGFDPNFTSPYLPKKDTLPSMIIATLPGFSELGSQKLSLCAGLDKMPESCSTDKLDKILKKATSNTFQFSDVVYYFQENINYNTRRYFKFIKNLENYGAVKINYDPKYFTFDIYATTSRPVLLFTHVALHNNIGVSIGKVTNYTGWPSYVIEDKKMYSLDKEIYFCYTINEKQYLQINIRVSNLVKIPDVVKLKCSFIREQIDNSKHSKDIVCFCPDLKTNSKYTFYEVESKNFLQLSNTTLDVLDFTLVDQTNRQLPLREGTPTFVKLHFKKMSSFKKSFHVRLSSASTREFNNELSSFQVRLPTTLNFNRDWKVAMTSILIPGKYCTIPVPGEVMFTYKTGTEIVVHKDWFPMREFKKEELFEWINSFFGSHKKKIGVLRENIASNEYESTPEFQFFMEGFFILPEHVCRVLGYGADDFTKGKKRFDIKFKQGETSHKLKMSNGLNMEYYRPNYIMAYSNIVEPTPINSEMTNLLKVFQVSSERKYMLYEFKHLEQHRLLNDVINTIRVELRTHAGDLVRFEKKSNAEVIVNFLFSNY